MPVIVRVAHREMFRDDDSIFHEILASHGIQKGDYEVELDADFPMLIFDELSDDVARDLETIEVVQVARVD